MLRVTVPLIGLCLLFLLFTGCRKDSPLKEINIADHMVLVYVGANNNLHNDAIVSINKMIAGAKSLKKNDALLIYAKTQAQSTLLKVHNNSGSIIIDTLKKYATGNSSDPAFLNEVIKTARLNSPAKSYGLVLWSHATSWAPPAKIVTKSFGSDDFEEMDIKDLNSALPSDWDYIMFDACSMASLEVVSELKRKARFLLASPTEVLSSSFPYDEVMPYLFSDENGLKMAAQKFIEYYKIQPDLYASATVSLIKTDGIDSIAVLTKKLIGDKTPQFPFNLNKIQSLNFDKDSGVPAYDFMDFLEQNYEVSYLQKIKDQLDKVVIYKNHTSNFFGIPISSYCGLSVYLSNSASDPYKSYYKTLTWSLESDWFKIFQ